MSLAILNVRLSSTGLLSSPLLHRLARATGWSLVGALGSRGLSLLASILVARLLGKESFGQFGMLQSTVGTFSVLAGFGLGLTATKFIAEFKEIAPARAARLLGMSSLLSWATGTLGAAVLCLCAPWLASHTLANPELTKPLQISSLLVLLGAVNGAQLGALAGFEAFKRIAQVTFIAGLVNFPCLISGAVLAGLPGSIWGLVVAQAAACGISRWAIRKEATRAALPPSPHGWACELSLLWSFSLPATLASLLVAPTLWYCQTLLLHHATGYEAVAEYSVATQWRTFLQFLPSLVCSAYLPILVSTDANAHGEKRRALIATLAISCSLTALTAILAFAASPYILSAYGSGFASARAVFGLLLLAGVVDSASMMVTQTLVAFGRVWLRLATNTCWAMLMVAASLAFVPHHAAVGLALATCIAYSAHLLMQMPLAFRLIPKTHSHS